jgi:hypothetical protein
MVIIAENDEEREDLQDFFLDRQTAEIFHEKIPVNNFSIVQLPEGYFDLMLKIAEISGMFDHPTKVKSSRVRARKKKDKSQNGSQSDQTEGDK